MARSSRKKKKAEAASALADRRSSGRRRQEFLETNFGPVLDLSRGGARILTRRELESEVDLILKSLAGDLTLRARVRWTRRAGFRKFEVGLMFVGVDPLSLQRLSEISTQHRLWYEESE